MVLTTNKSGQFLIGRLTAGSVMTSCDAGIESGLESRSEETPPPRLGPLSADPTIARDVRQARQHVKSLDSSI